MIEIFVILNRDHSMLDTRLQALKMRYLFQKNSEGNINNDLLCVARKYIVLKIVLLRLHVILSSVVLLIVRPESREHGLREVRC